MVERCGDEQNVHGGKVTMRKALVRNATRTVLDIERANTECKTIKLVNVEMIGREGKEGKGQRKVAFELPNWMYEFLAGSKPLIGSELWTVNSCEKIRTYRVNYFKEDGDSFFARVGGTDFSTVMSKIWHVIKSQIKH